MWERIRTFHWLTGLGRTYAARSARAGEREHDLLRTICCAKYATHILLHKDAAADYHRAPMWKKKNIDETREITDKAFRDSIFFEPYKQVAFRGEYAWWRLRGSPQPKVPHIIKQQTIAEFGERYGLHVMVETGSNLGHMINAQKDRF